MTSRSNLAAASAGRPAGLPFPGGPFICPDQVVELETAVKTAAIPFSVWSNEWRIVRLSQLPAARFDDFKDWIDAQAVIGKRGAA